MNSAARRGIPMIRLDKSVTNLLASIARLRTNIDQMEVSLVKALRGEKPEPTQVLTSVHEDIELATASAKNVTQRLGHMQDLINMSALLTSSLELDHVLAEVIDAVIKLTGAERAYLMLQEPDTAQLTIRAARNWDHESLSSQDAVFSRGIVNAVIEEKQPVLTTNAQADERFEEMASVMEHTLRSVVCVPLILRKDVIGVLYADHRMKDAQFGRDLLPLMIAFGNQAAIAIDNAKMFTKVKADLAAATMAVRSLRIMIDHDMAQQQIDEISQDEYFKKLQDLAREYDQALDL